MYVVKVMQQEQSKLSDETMPGIACEIEIKKQGKYSYKKAKLVDEKFDALANDDEVFVLLPSEHEDLLQQTNVDEHKPIEDLQAKLQEQSQTIADLKQMNDNLAKEKDAIEKQLNNSADASEIEILQNEIQDLKKQVSEHKSNYESTFSDYIKTNDECIAINEDNNKLKETNKFLNEQIVGLKTTFDETKQEMQSDFEKQEKELKETIKKQQSHIDELTQTKDSLLPLKDNIAQKQHYNEINALKDKIRTKENEISKLNSEIETKLASQKSDLEIQHANEKAQLLVAYNQDINKMKLQYNNLAKDYNHLLNGVESLTRINTLMNGKHNEIKKNKEQVPLLEITSEQLPPSDEHVIEFVPKD